MKTPSSKEYPRTHLLNPEFKYVKSVDTDIRKTFEKVSVSIKEKNKSCA